ncbi:putative disease resistance protein RGA3 [Quercus lobata]|uniref:putative disease resistance protein RGA3 n=1 Tax=Quercus lobata TaxID=97700 RepID=UPI00124418FB|nr:putative disease resistance protein RGA3 [Quercus lobata]
MADAILIELFKEVGSFVFQVAKQEIESLVGFDEEVQKLQGNLRMIKAKLDDAEERHAVKQRTEKLWLEQLQNQYYEMDDILDTWNTARIRAEIEKEEGKPADTNASAVVKKKVCSFIPSPSCCFNLPLRHDVGHKIRKLNEKLDMVFKDKATYGIDFNRQPDVVERPTTTSFVDVSQIIGRDIYRDYLLKNLLGEGSQEETNSYCVISLVGLGGIGKTALAQLAYNHPDVQAHFQKRMWICVSDPFDQCNVAKAIIKEVDPRHEPLNDTKLQTLLCKIQDLIKDKKYFLVLDDVWTEDFQKWEPFKIALKSDVHGSRILVTTRKQRAAEVMGSVLTINLKVLSDEDCWSIFSKIAFSNEEQLKYLEDLGRKLAIKCKGLPLAAKTLGSLMQNKRSREQWNKILDSHMWELEDIEKGLLAPLLLSYYELPSTMRRCFSYCAVFAKDYRFSRDQLVLQWIAQGYIESKANMELEDIAEEYFEKLAMHSFFQDFWPDEVNDDKIKSCKMHDIVHDFAQFMSKNESFVIDSDKKLETDCQIARHLHLEISKEMQHLESIYHAKCLRTLFLLSHDMDYEFEMLLSNSFHHFKCLRTLILDCPIKKLPDAVENLIHLRCLFISENVKIVKLPETFCNLCNLQTLKIENHGCFKKLPQGMSKQINLRHLIFNDDIYSNLVVFPKGIGKLIGLRTLSEFNIGDKNDREGCKLGELKNLNQLRGTLKIYGMGNVVNVDEAHNAQLKDKIHLRGLVLMFEGLGFDEGEERMENDVRVLTALGLPPNLQCLTIWHYQGNTIYPTLPSLGQLPFLEVLDIQGLDNVKKVGDEFLGIEDSKNKKDYGIIFPNLKSLEFGEMNNWEEWIGMEVTGEEEEENDNGIVTNPIIIKIMPRLQTLTIYFCNKLKSLPNYLLTAPLLKELRISGSRLLQERYQRGTRENWHKISHISNIMFDWKSVQRNGEAQFDSESTNQQNEFGSEISDKDDVGAASAECVVDELVEVDNDQGLEICDADR